MTTNAGIISSPCTIPSGGTTSNAVTTGGGPLVLIFAPAMTGTSLSFEVATADAPNTFVPLRNSVGAAITQTVSTSTAGAYRVDPLPFGAAFLRVVSSATEAADRAINLSFQAVV
jgi:hypothetical protein